MNDLHTTPRNEGETMVAGLRAKLGLVTHFADHCDPVLSPAGEPINSANRMEWLEARRALITASDIAALMGLDPRRSALSVFLSKRWPVEKETMTWADPRFWGLELEQAIGRIFASYTGMEFHPGGYLLKSKKYPFLGATLDAEVRPANENWRPYEGKNVSTWFANDWEPESQTPPYRVLVQCTSQLMVTQADICHAFALIGGNTPCPVEIAPHQANVDGIDLEDLIVTLAEEFMDNLQKDNPAAYPATHKDTDAINRTYPQDDGTTKNLGSEAVQMVEDCHHYAKEAQAFVRKQEAMKNQLKMLLGEATYGVLPMPVNVEDERAGQPITKTFNFVKWALEHRNAYYAEESSSKPIRFLKNHPNQITTRKRRRR